MAALRRARWTAFPVVVVIVGVWAPVIPVVVVFVVAIVGAWVVGLESVSARSRTMPVASLSPSSPDPSRCASSFGWAEGAMLSSWGRSADSANNAALVNVVEVCRDGPCAEQYPEFLTDFSHPG